MRVWVHANWLRHRDWHLTVSAFLFRALVFLAEGAAEPPIGAYLGWQETGGVVL